MICPICGTPLSDMRCTECGAEVRKLSDKPLPKQTPKKTAIFIKGGGLVKIGTIVLIIGLVIIGISIIITFFS